MDLSITVPMRWLDIKGYERIYQVSDKGLIKSLPRMIEYRGKASRWQDEQILRLNNSNGYRTVSLVKNKIKKTHMVHILVGSAFIVNLDNRPFINHKDGMRWNNHFKNLEWSTNSENQLHSYNILGNRAVCGEKNGQSKLTEANVKEIRRLAADGYALSELSMIYNVSESLIGFVKNKKRWVHVD